MGVYSLSGVAKFILVKTGTLNLARRLRARATAPMVGPGELTEENGASYKARVCAELATFENDALVHNLPPIFHYWSNKYLLPLIKPFGFIHPDDFFVQQLAKVIHDNPSSHKLAFISIGAGNCDTEVRVAQGLLNLGHTNFSIECLDLNLSMLQRGTTLAREQGLAAYVLPVEGDFNKWRPARPYHAVIANQSLHHVLALEHLFDAIEVAVRPSGGVLITSDMIGRNGHQRWPEALAIVEEFWGELTDKHKYNHQLRRTESSFVNWDCAGDGFEGIRAQDIMPLLSERFHFDLFVAFSNVIAPFIDRSFGHNFDVNSELDRAFIDRVHARDAHEISAGKIKPTQMFAVLSFDRLKPTLCIDGLTPQFCTRNPRPSFDNQAVSLPRPGCA